MAGFKPVFCLTLAVLAAHSLAYVCPVDMESTELIDDRGFDLSGQTHVLTGGDSGIGKGIAMALAKANARLIFLGHNMESTAGVMKWITQSTGNEKLSAIPIDLFSFASVQKALDELLEQTDRIDSVIGDAGADAGADGTIPDFVTEDGFESVVQMEYMSHFYLVEKLLPKLRESKGRVVYTSTTGIDPYLALGGLCSYSGEEQGCQSIKQLSKSVHSLVDKSTNPGASNIMKGLYLRTLHARHLSLTESDVTAFSFHPGVVATEGFKPLLDTGLGKTVAQGCKAIPWFNCMCRGADDVEKTCPLNSFQGAVTGTYLAAAPTAELKPINGEMLVACGAHPKGPEDHFDPYDTMGAHIGKDATDEYLTQLMDVSKSWVSAVGTEESVSKSVPASTTKGLVLLPWFLLLGVVAGFAAKTKRTSEQGDYLRLDVEAES